MFWSLRKRETNQCQSQRSLYKTATDSKYLLQRLKLDRKLSVHDGCVNTIAWNDRGTLILSGSDDQHLAITDPFSGKNVVKLKSGHRSNIFSAKFLPGSMDREVVSCSGSGEIFYTDVERLDTHGTHRFDCHFGTTYKVLVVPNEASTFLSCGDDGTVRFFDLRTKTHCSKFNCEDDVIVHLRSAVTAIAVDPVIPYQLAVAASDGIVRVYDRRMLKTSDIGGANESLLCTLASPASREETRHYRITSLNYRPGSHDILVNYSSENLYLFNTYDLARQQTYSTADMKMSTNQTRGGASSDNGGNAETVHKPIKRLRLRGDWSDTGPDAKPESEEAAANNTIMQRMSDLLTRMLNSSRTEDAVLSTLQEETLRPRERVVVSNEGIVSPETSSQDHEDETDILPQTDNGRDNPVGSDKTVPEDTTHEYQNVASSETETHLDDFDFQSIVIPKPQNRSSNQCNAVDSEGSEPEDGECSSQQEDNEHSSHSSQDVKISLAKKGDSQIRYVNKASSRRVAESSGWKPKPNNGPEQTQVIEQKLNNGPEQTGVEVKITTLDTSADNSNIKDVDSFADTSKLAAQGATEAHAIETLPGVEEVSELNTVVEKAPVKDRDSVDAKYDHEVEQKSLIKDTNSVNDGHEDQNVDENKTPVVDVNSVKKKNKDGNTLKRDSEGKSNSSDSNPLSSQDSMYGFSWSDSPVALAERMNSNYEGNFRSLDDVSNLPSDSTLMADTQEASQSRGEASQSTRRLVEDHGSHSGGSVQDLSSGSSATVHAVMSDNSEENSGSFPNCDSHSGDTTVVKIADGEPRLDAVGKQVTTEVTQRQTVDLSDMCELCQIERVIPNRLLCSKCLEKNKSLISKNQTDSLLKNQTAEGAEGGCDDPVINPKVQYEHLNSGEPKRESKGKGKGKSSVKGSQHKGKCTGKVTVSPDKVTSPEKVNHAKKVSCKGKVTASDNMSASERTPYNSGRMRLSTTDKSRPHRSFSLDRQKETQSEAALHTSPQSSTDDFDPTPGFRQSTSSGPSRQRRSGHSLPPTGTFQLYGDDDLDSDEEEGGGHGRGPLSRKIHEATDTARKASAAKKIQDMFRRKREARERAKVMDVPQAKVIMKFKGHRNCRTMIKEANFYGDQFVMSGSDCGRILAWDIDTGAMVMYLDADKHVVNCIQPHPSAPVLASSGIDYDIKVWTPGEVEPLFDPEVADRIVHRNELMLEETRDTVTVPAAFMLRVLASLSQIRSERSSARNQASQEQEEPSGEE